jgi:large subunit ribosomal protein L1
MAIVSKRMKTILNQYEKTKFYTANEAFTLLKKLSKIKFTESIDVAINLGVDPRKSDQIVRGASILPKSTGKNIRVAVFAQGEDIEKAKKAGADLVGMQNLAKQIEEGIIDFDVVIATPDTMKLVSKLGQILGPKGLMPNPKVGTITNNVELAIKNAKAGQVRYRVDKTGIIHTTIGNVTLDPSDLKKNLETLVADLKKLKPPNAKGIYLKKITVSSTMGPGLTLDTTSLEVYH